MDLKLGGLNVYSSKLFRIALIFQMNGNVGMKIKNIYNTTSCLELQVY